MAFKLRSLTFAKRSCVGQETRDDFPRMSDRKIRGHLRLVRSCWLRRGSSLWCNSNIGRTWYTTQNEQGVWPTSSSLGV
jgi:hypothetical protein